MKPHFASARDAPKRRKHVVHQQSCDSTSQLKIGLPDRVVRGPERSQQILLSFDECQVVFPGGQLELDRLGGIDLFSGGRGVAKEMIRRGATWVLCFDWERSAYEDLLCPQLRAKID